MNIEIISGNTKLEAVLNETKTAAAIQDSLPIEGKANTWGSEIYFPVSADIEPEPENADDVVELGDLAYWPDGGMFCIFFGPTPASVGTEPRAISPVTVFGRITGDIAGLKAISQGAAVSVRQKDS